jgi:hypothetical protein
VGLLRLPHSRPVSARSLVTQFGGLETKTATKGAVEVSESSHAEAGPNLYGTQPLKRKDPMAERVGFEPTVR